MHLTRIMTLTDIAQFISVLAKHAVAIVRMLFAVIVRTLYSVISTVSANEAVASI